MAMVSALFTPHTGGTETHIYQVARHLAQAGVDISVLTTNHSGDLPAYECVEGIHIHRVRAYPKGSDLFYAPGLYPLMTQGKWDLLHVQSYHTLVPPLAMLAALRASIPYVLTFHGGGHSSQLRNRIRRMQWLALQPLLAHAARLIAVADFEIALFGKALRLPTSRFALIPNGCDLGSEAQAEPQQAAASCRTNGTSIVSIGRLEKYKGHQHAIAALPKVIAQQPDAYLRIAGSGPYKAQLLDLARQLGVAERVEIRAVPSGNRAEMAQLLSSAALVTLFSDYETHPIAALEALALRRPLLVTHTSGLAELAERGLAPSVPLNSTADQIASAMLAQLRHPRPAPQIELPTWEQCTTDLLKLYREVLSEQTSRANQTLRRSPACAS